MTKVIVRRVARRDASNNIYYYYFEDHLGTSRVITNATGTGCYDADFYPYGGERVYVNTCPQNYKFTGKERDVETGLDDFTARYYSSQFGRFTIADWSAAPVPVPYADLVNPQTLNLYAYVKNNPLRYNDPAGHVSNPFDGGSGGRYASDTVGSSGGVCLMTATGVGGRCVSGANIYDESSDFSFINSQKNTEQNNSSSANNQDQQQGLQLTYTATIGGRSDRDVVQPPTFMQIDITPTDQLVPGTYQVDVSLTRADNGKKVKAELESRVETAKAGGGNVIGQPSTNYAKVPLIVGVSAEKGNFHYEGKAYVNVVLTAPNGQKGGISVPVLLQRGNPGAASVSGRVGGRTTFVVPESN